MIKYSEEELVALLKNKDMNAFNALYDAYSAAIFGVVIRVVENEDVAQELLQDAFVKIWRNIEGYDQSKGRLYTWMLNIARNTAIDYKRSKQSKQSDKNRNIENVVYEVNRQNAVSMDTDMIGIKQEVEKLKTDYLQLIDLIYFKGYTQEETAQQLNIPLGTVKTRVRAAIQQLREALK
jgi:RNA polymerase sigma-70 factor, ECF subfamily